MFTLRQKVIYFALISRISIVILQAVANAVIPDHVAQGVFVRPTKIKSVNIFDRLIDALLGGFERWDAHYFLHIAEHGYVFENTVAFFPLFPILVKFSSRILNIFFNGVLNDRSLLLLSAITLNIFCFIKSADVLHMLSILVLKDPRVAYKAALLFCINPASVFFSSPYSETLFSLLSFYGMYSSLNEKLARFCALPFGLAAATRSNGILNIGFILFYEIRKLLLVKWPTLLKSNRLWDRVILPFKLFASLSVTVQSCIIAFGPFIAFQWHCYQLFCTPMQISFPDNIRDYGIINNLVMPSTEPNPKYWCNSTLPLAYSYVQSHYWNVGFMKYYEWKQLPNFALSAPVITFIIYNSVVYFIQHSDLLLCVGLKYKTMSVKQMQKTGIMSPDMFVFVAHCLFLTLFCVLFVHIQVSTRMLFSSSPVPYWYAAYWLSNTALETLSKCKHEGMEKVRKQIKRSTFKDHVNEETTTTEINYICESVANRQSYWRVIIFNHPFSKFRVIVLIYFLGYALIGTVLFSNFFPWT